MPPEAKAKPKQEEFDNFRPKPVKALDAALEDHKEKQAEATESKKLAKTAREKLTTLMNEHRDKLRGPDGTVVYESEVGRVELVEKGIDVRIKKPRKPAKADVESEDRE
jgi:hypothetical protein